MGAVRGQRLRLTRIVIFLKLSFQDLDCFLAISVIGGLGECDEEDDLLVGLEFDALEEVEHVVAHVGDLQVFEGLESTPRIRWAPGAGSWGVGSGS